MDNDAKPFGPTTVTLWALANLASKTSRTNKAVERTPYDSG
jgi:hypothetical protein